MEITISVALNKSATTVRCVIVFDAALTCGCSSGSRMLASSKGRWCCRTSASWRTHVSREVTRVSSSGTLMSSDVISLSISSIGSNRNSWPPTTSKKCSWWTERWHGHKVGRSLQTGLMKNSLRMKNGMSGGVKKYIIIERYEWWEERDQGVRRRHEERNKRKEMRAWERSEGDGRRDADKRGNKRLEWFSYLYKIASKTTFLHY